MSLNKTIQKREHVFEVPKKVSSIPLNIRNRMRLEKQKNPSTPVPRPGPQNISRKKHNCLNQVTPENTPNRPCRPLSTIKSYSMVELNTALESFSQNKNKSKEQGDECGIECSIISISECRLVNVTFPLEKSEAEIVTKAYKKFLLNAWRKCRGRVAELEKDVSNYKKQLDGKSIAINLLRQYYESEKLRVAIAMGDSAHLKDRLERELKTNGLLEAEIVSFKDEKAKWINTQKHLENEILRLTDELKSASERIFHLENEREQYKMDISKLKATELELFNKIGRTETQLKDKISVIQDMKDKLKSLQTQISRLLMQNKTLTEANKNKQKEMDDCIKRNAKLIEELNNMKNTYKTQSENIKNLTKELEIATETVEKQDRTIRDLENSLYQYEKEKQLFKDNLKATRNQIIFEAIKASAKLFFPVPFLGDRHTNSA